MTRIKKVIMSVFVCGLLLFVGMGVCVVTPVIVNAAETEVTIVAEGNASYEQWDEETSTYVSPVKWKLDSEGTLTIFGEGAMNDYRYYSWDNQYGETPWKQYRSSIKKIVIEEGITEIGNWAFAGLTNVTSEPILPNSLKDIGQYSFAGCSGLSGDLVVPASVTYIGTGAFGEARLGYGEYGYNYSYCSGLNGTLKFAGMLPDIANGAFKGAGFTAVELPEGMTEIPAYIFDGMSNMKSVELPQTLTSIKKYAFRGTGIESIDIPDTVTNVGIGAFKNCKALTTVDMSAKAEYIRDYAFQNCSELTFIEIPGTVEQIGGSAFAKCTSLTEVKLNEGLTNIGNYAFSKCSALEKINLPDTLTRVGNYAFRECKALEQLSVGKNIKTIGSQAFYNCQNMDGNLEFSNALEVIGADAFYNCKKLESIKLQGNNVTIGYYAFQNCTGLTSIEIGEGIVSIGHRTFSNCKNVKGKLVLPETLTSVGSYAFSWCDNLEEVVLPDSLTVIPYGMFYNCNNLSKVAFGNNVIRIESDAFERCNLSGELVLPATLEYIGAYAFAGNKGFTGELAIPEKVTYIGYSAFNSYSSYYEEDEYATNPNATPVYTFSGKLHLPEGLKNIEGYAFAGTGFDSYDMPSTVTEIGYGIFSNCKNITEVKLPEGMTTIPYGMFAKCPGLTDVTIPANVTAIESYAFYSCKNLKEVSIHDKVIKIETNAFRYCNDMDELVIPKSVEVIGDYVTDYDTVIKCYKGSDAEAFAIEKDCPYALIDGTDEENTISGEKGDTLTWTINKNTGMLTVNTIGGKMQTFLNRTAPWAEYSEYISSVVITGEPSNIGARAFKNLTKLSAITIPNSVKIIDKEAFQGCDRLKTITIPSSVETIGYEAFYESGLEYVELSDGLKEIGYQAFMSTHLKAINIPNTVEKLGNNAFRLCYLTEFTIPASITSLEYDKNEDDLYYQKDNFNGLVSRNYGLQKLVIKNRYCVIPDAFSLHNKDNLEIHGWEGSTAEQFAKDNGLTFVPLDSIMHIHTWGEPFIAKEASCAEGALGIERKLCTECGEHNDKEVPGTQHKPVTDKAYEPDCIHTGRTEGSHCSICGTIIVAQEIIPAKGHTKSIVKAAVEPTCTEDGMSKSVVCEVCDEVLLEAEIVPSKGHDYRAHVTKPTCTDGGYTTYTCTKCNDSYVVDHTSATQHKEVVDPAVAATCTESGLTAGSHCEKCKVVIKAQERVPAKGHTRVTTSAVAATCTKDGSTKAVSCSTCGDVILTAEKVPALGHKYIDSVTKATCTEGGYTTHICTRCDSVYTDNKTGANGHKAVTDAAVAATCTESGLTEGSHCTTCGTVIKAQERIPAKGHTRVTSKAVEATCTAEGTTQGISCSTCGDVILKAEKVPALGHKYIDSVTKATCTESGYTTHNCTRCNSSYVDNKTSAVGHKAVTDSAVPATCKATGMTEGSHCGVCGIVIKAQQKVNAVGHSYSASVLVPTCTTGGYTTHTCTRCENTFIDTTTKATGHRYSKWVVVEKASCTEDGEKQRTCNTCGEKDTDVILALDHNAKTVITRATVEDEGVISEVCRRCNVTLSEETVAAIKAVSLNETEYVYNNNVNKPNVKVTDTEGNVLIKGVDYTVTYNTEGKIVGKHTVLVKFKGEYSGKKTLSYVINPKVAKLATLTKGNKQITVKWIQQTAQVTGYEIRYSTKASMAGAKTKLVTKAGTTSLKLTGLKAKTKYYVQIRTYKTVKGVKYYSVWSAKKTMKTK